MISSCQLRPITVRCCCIWFLFIAASFRRETGRASRPVLRLTAGLILWFLFFFRADIKIKGACSLLPPAPVPRRVSAYCQWSLQSPGGAGSSPPSFQRCCVSFRTVWFCLTFSVPIKQKKNKFFSRRWSHSRRVLSSFVFFLLQNVCTTKEKYTK